MSKGYSLLFRSRRESQNHMCGVLQDCAGYNASVSVTERKPRIGEENGHYCFLSKQEFDEMIENDG